LPLPAGPDAAATRECATACNEKTRTLLGDAGFFIHVPGGKIVGAPSRNRTGTPLRARDFKSRVSTSFTIGAARQDSSTGVHRQGQSCKIAGFQGKGGYGRAIEWCSMLPGAKNAFMCAPNKKYKDPNFEYHHP
jgi:hypothetical protein